MHEFEAVIGLEIHAQLLTQTKMFCGCSTQFGGEPNTQTCPVCQGLPGALPVLNKRAVELALRVGIAVDSKINGRSSFARKNYFYPDVPKNYQISQYQEPLCSGGWVEVALGTDRRRIGLSRIHLEEDAGKSIHLEESGVRRTLLDFNRCGVPLIEVVTLPEMRLPSEAYAFLVTLKQILEYVGASRGNMEEGALRCDVNVSVRKKGDERLGVKTEVKNLNSFRNVERALEYEIERQGRILAEGGTLVSETLLWDATEDKVIPMRSKEESHDYRYFPEPDLLELTVTDEWVAEIRHGLPELPGSREKRFVEVYGLPSYDARVLCSRTQLADYFEEVARFSGDSKAASNWIMTEVMREVKLKEAASADFPVTAENLAALLRLVRDGTVSGKMAKEMFAEMAATGVSASDIVRSRGLSQITDVATVRRIVKEVIVENRRPVSDYVGGKARSFGFLVGQIMKKSEGRASPTIANDLLREELEKVKREKNRADGKH
jgi:aspartyl-tRNA(Asn)/glutamyl-tRNA(Gln) amidotransferase subunit B